MDEVHFGSHKTATMGQHDVEALVDSARLIMQKANDGDADARLFAPILAGKTPQYYFLTDNVEASEDSLQRYCILHNVRRFQRTGKIIRPVPPFARAAAVQHRYATGASKQAAWCDRQPTSICESTRMSP